MVVMSPDFCLACGNYSEDRDEEAFIIGTNPIIYCSLCHIGVHMKCVGLESVPEDFICDKCKFLKRGFPFSLFFTPRRRSQRPPLPLLPQHLRLSLPMRRSCVRHCREARLCPPPLLSLYRWLHNPLVLPARSAGSPSQRPLQGHLPRPLGLSRPLQRSVRALGNAHAAAGAEFGDAVSVERGAPLGVGHAASNGSRGDAERRGDADFQQHQNGVRSRGDHAAAALHGLPIDAFEQSGRFVQRESEAEQSPYGSFFLFFITSFHRNHAASSSRSALAFSHHHQQGLWHALLDLPRPFGPHAPLCAARLSARRPSFLSLVHRRRTHRRLHAPVRRIGRFSARSRVLRGASAGRSDEEEDDWLTSRNGHVTRS